MQSRVLFPTIALAALLVSTSAGAANLKATAGETPSAAPASTQGTPTRPTLTEWGTLGLGFGLGLFGFAAMRRRSRVRASSRP